MEEHVLKPADPAALKRIFTKYATVEMEGQKFMSLENLIRDYLGMQKVDEYNEVTLKLLAGVVDQTKDRLISFSEFLAFETLLRNPDAQHKIIFQLFDLDGKGAVSFAEFESVIKETTFHDKLKFDFGSEFIASYFGADKKRLVVFEEFSQLLQDLAKEYQRQAFFHTKMKDGKISAVHFSNIMKTIRGHELTPYVRAYLLAVGGGEARHLVSYGYYRGFNTMLDNIHALHDLAMSSTNGNRFREIKREDLLISAKNHPEVTPLQIDILFHLCDVEHKRRRITVSDIHQIVPKVDVFKVFSTERRDIQEDVIMESQEEEKVSIFWHSVEQIYRFSLGSFAGAAGATTVYPIDLVKTRMQNQRAVLASDMKYKNSLDCFFQVIRNEGLLGLYRGLPPQIVGVAPEKAIKLTTNDFVRDRFRDKDGFISLPYEIVAGGCGGAAQVLFTNPLEIVKIRLQVAGEVGSMGPKVTAIRVMKELGLSGLYKGARACFLRDIPFSGIYFPAYAHLKSAFANADGHVGAGGLFASAMIAGVPAAAGVTPADVIKTRLQVKARQGDAVYRGVMDCFTKVLKEEGARAFWKGAGARVLRSSPQFGVTLLTYELLQRAFNVDFSGRGAVVQPWSETTYINPEMSRHPDHIGGMRLAVSMFAGIETKFGLCLPKFRSPQVATANQGKET